MTTMQAALGAAIPELPRILAECRRKEAHTKAVVRGKKLLLEATRHTRDHQPAAALKAVRRDREACACYLAASLGLPVMAPKGRRSGFSELELMERFWQEKVEAEEGVAVAG